ncbi:MAG: Fic family protein [Candidatus Saganbacteria bacterium]|nr:Fic family protein [Candidatus Saganbacteria bacterium]
MDSRAIVKYYRQPSQRITNFIARYGLKQSAADMLRRHSAEEITLHINAHGFPVDRAADIIYSYLSDGRLDLSIDLICLAKYEVLEALWQRYGQTIISWFNSGQPRSQVAACVFLHEFAYYLPAGLRGDVISGLADMPRKVQLSPVLMLDTTGYTFCLRIRLKTMAALDQLDRLVANVPHNFPYNELIRVFLRDRLEFFPVEDPNQTDPDTGMIFESRVNKDISKIGTGLETMEKMLRSEDITEDMIKRVQGTHYCQRPYGEAENYRTDAIWRSSQTQTTLMTPPEQVGPMMKELIGWVNSARAKALHPFIRAHIFYARYDQIHPFEGRTKHAARFFLFQMLLRGKDGLKYPPLFDELDLHLTLFFQAPHSSSSTFFFDRGFNAVTLMKEELYDEFVFQMLYLYSQKLSAFFCNHPTPKQTEALTAIADILSSEAMPTARMFWF